MSTDEFREFAREQQLRFERMMREFTRDLRAMAAELKQSNEETRRQLAETHLREMRKLDAMEAQSRELIEESRAERQALLAILDRVNGGGAAPAT